MFLRVLVFFIFLSLPAFAEEISQNYFDKQKNYTDELYIFKDHIKFSVFDMSDMKLIDNSGTAKKSQPKDLKSENVDSKDKIVILKEDGQNETLISPSGKIIPLASLNAAQEVQDQIKEIPKYFFKALRQELYRQQVPLIAYSSVAPDYANPIKLYIKVKEIDLHSVVQKSSGEFVQPITMRVYGQIKDNQSGKIFMRYYDSAQSQFILGQSGSGSALKKMAREMMQNLTLFLRTRY